VTPRKIARSEASSYFTCHVPRSGFTWLRAIMWCCHHHHSINRMLTTSHALMGYLIYEKKSKNERIYVVIGSVIPDITFFVAIPFLFIVSPQQLLDSFLSHKDIYASNADFIIGSILNSAWLWIAIIGLGKFLWKPLLPFGIGAIVHAFADALTHQGSWAWNHLYPLKIAPVQGLFDFMNPWFLLVEHTIWLIIFAPRIWRHFQKKAVTNASKK